MKIILRELNNNIALHGCGVEGIPKGRRVFFAFWYAKRKGNDGDEKEESKIKSTASWSYIKCFNQCSSFNICYLCMVCFQ